MSAARASMIHRTTIERNVPVSDTGGGETDVWSQMGDVIHCRAWSVSSRIALLSDRPGVEKIRHVIMPRGTDVMEGDQLPLVINRKGAILFDGPLHVEAVAERPDHLHLTTRRIS